MEALMPPDSKPPTVEDLMVEVKKWTSAAFSYHDPKDTRDIEKRLIVAQDALAADRVDHHDGGAAHVQARAGVVRGLRARVGETMSDPLVEEVDFLVAQARMKRDLIFTKVDGFWRERVDDLVELVERAVRERDEAIHSGDLLMIRA